MFGSIVSATDPVAVVALLKELGASRRLATLIEGESLLNDGTAMVVFLVLFDIVEGKELEVGEVIGRFFRLAFGGILLGILGGAVCSFFLARIFNNPVLEVNTTIVHAYLIFYIAEGTELKVSGILAIVGLGLYMTKTGKTHISAESEHAVHHVWSYIGFVAETVIFILSGLIMGIRWRDSSLTFGDVALVFASYAILHVIRFILTVAFWPCLHSSGYSVNFRQVVLISYSGLRGAVGLSLALIVANSPKIPLYVRDVVLLHVSGVALLTLIINATTTGWLVRKLGLSKQSDFEKSIVLSLTDRLARNVNENIEALRNKRHFNHVEWSKLRKDIDMRELKDSLKRFASLKIEDAELHHMDNLGHLKHINQKITEVTK